MKFVSYDPVCDEITVLQKGAKSIREIPLFIGSGQVDDLSNADRARLYVMLKKHPQVVADQGVYGCYSFSLLTQQNMLMVLGGLYLTLLVLCPIVFMRHFHVQGMEFTGGSILFPLTYFILDAISELYGIRRARQTVIYSSAMLILVAAVWWLHVKFLEGSVHSSGPDHHDMQPVELLYRELPGNFLALGVSLLITDMVNIYLFQLIRSWMNNHWFIVRSAFSTSFALGLFSLIAPVARYQDYWNDPDTLSFVIDTTLMKLWLVPIYLFIGVGIVFGTRYWRRRYVK
ncbi:queuosine precursor transporter [Endozoicomonas atrinae]|uniref:queuosine precursor transporter n=1 Tax=Endozoicomonas atrinae TaxID=1333660 RepID=UPI0008271D3A|nr:queuosine precursor transporter [Endozoicomonas atrinae]